ncbi:hypothetical protein ACV17F_005207 [Vibrio harveyi]
MKYQLRLVQKDSQGSDGQVNLTLSVERSSPPIFLSEFAGGNAEIYDGYSTHTSRFRIIPMEPDNRRLSLISDSDSISDATLHPEFVRKIDPSDPLNQLQVLPLKNGQLLTLSFKCDGYGKKYIVTYLG